MKKGHVVGTKKEKMTAGQQWYYATEEAQTLLAQLDAEWAAKSAPTETQTPRAQKAIDACQP